MREHEVGPGTVQSALRALAAEGLVEARPGVGTFIATPRGTRLRASDYSWQAGALGARDSLGSVSRVDTVQKTTPDAIALHIGYPDRNLLPETLVRQTLTRAARSEYAVAAAPRAGLAELRSWFAHELAQHTPSTVSAPSSADVTVLPGTQSGLAAIFRAVADPGEPVVIESPTYWGAILAAAQTGVQLEPVAGGMSGPDPVELDRILTRTGARLFYAQPRYTNPTGVVWSPVRRGDILEVLEKHGAFLVEDDWAHDLGFAEPDEQSPMAAHDDSGRIIYLRSLTKSVSPSLRIGAVIARGPVRERILANVAASSMYVSPVLQAAALDVVGQPSWRTHLKRLRGELRARRDLMVEAVTTHLGEDSLSSVPAGGLNLWVRLPDATDLHRLVSDCERAGVVIASGDALFPAEAAGRYTRLNFGGPDPGRFDEALSVIADCLAQQSATPR